MKATLSLEQHKDHDSLRVELEASTETEMAMARSFCREATMRVIGTLATWSTIASRYTVSFDVPSDLGAFHAKQIIAIARTHALEVELK